MEILLDIFGAIWYDFVVIDSLLESKNDPMAKSL
jgi:hypothetical protein